MPTGYILSEDDYKVLKGVIDREKRAIKNDVRQPNIITRTPNNRALGKTDAAIDKGDEGTVSIYRGTTKGSEDDTGENVEAYNRFGDLGDDVWVLLEFIGGGWEIYQGEC